MKHLNNCIVPNARISRVLLLALLLFFSAFSVFAVPVQKYGSDTPVEMRQRIIATAAKYEGTPYILAGVSKKGMDCSGLIYCSFLDGVGVKPPRSVVDIYSWVDIISIEKAEPGDLLFFRTDTGKPNNLTHVGIFLGNDRFIHAASEGSRTGVIYSNLSEKYWKTAYAGVGRAMPATITSNVKKDESPVKTEKSSDKSSDKNNSSSKNSSSDKNDSSNKNDSSKSNTFLGVGAGVSFNLFDNDKDKKFVSGIVSQFRAGFNILNFSGALELRPEIDLNYNKFTLPITLSLGYQDKFSLFAGPVFIFDGSQGRLNDLENFNWTGIIGITLAPFNLTTKAGKFAPYIELGYLHHFDDNKSAFDPYSSTYAAVGLRWTK